MASGRKVQIDLCSKYLLTRMFEAKIPLHKDKASSDLCLADPDRTLLTYLLLTVRRPSGNRTLSRIDNQARERLLQGVGG